MPRTPTIELGYREITASAEGTTVAEFTQVGYEVEIPAIPLEVRLVLPHLVIEKPNKAVTITLVDKVAGGEQTIQTALAETGLTTENLPVAPIIVARRFIPEKLTNEPLVAGPRLLIAKLAAAEGKWKVEASATKVASLQVIALDRQ